MLILHAQRTDIKHKFIELFTTKEKLDLFVKNHPTIIVIEITYHEIDPE